MNERHPFDVEICRIPPGKTPYPYHSHSAQWEFYHVISGRGVVRHKDGTTGIEAGDAFIFKPGEPHQITNDGTEDLNLYVVADNPIGESGYYPDSKKWIVRFPSAESSAAMRWTTTTVKSEIAQSFVMHFALPVMKAPKVRQQASPGQRPGSLARQKKP